LVRQNGDKSPYYASASAALKLTSSLSNSYTPTTPMHHLFPP
jgi:hypothetical protein